jgi:outer membrane protein assembly factor BamB
MSVPPGGGVHRDMLRTLALLLVPVASLAAPVPPDPSPAATPSSRALASALAGAWAGTASHAGETTPVALELEPGDDGKVLIKLSAPIVHLRSAPLGRAVPQMEGGRVKLGPFLFTHDPVARTLTGEIPEGLAPVYKIPLSLQRVEKLDLPARPEPAVPAAQPAWTFDAHAPLWPGASFVDGVVYAGAEDGQMHALDAATGKERWSFAAGGAIRTRPVAAGDALYFQADDGVLYALDRAHGRERWRVRLGDKPVVRLPPGDPASRFDRFGSDVAVAGGRLYVGTHDGRVLCLDLADGREVWRFASGDSVLAAPALGDGRVYFGSYDGAVYALDAATGRPLWKRDTGKPVVSTPALSGDRVIVGSRSYDLLGLEAATGAVAWTRYIWFSWVESSPVVRDGIVYVGSSDAAALYAFDARSGRPVWKTDVWGWAWGQPAVTDRRVYMGTSALGGYLVGHRAGVMAVDRRTGAPAWRFVAASTPEKAYGFTGSAAAGDGRVYLAGLDGKVYAFAE